MEAIVAVYGDWGIGAEGTQPVTVKADRRHFREVTEGAAVIVGRRTLGDFPGGRPLKNRVNLVLTRGPEIPGAVTVRSVDEALTEAGKYPRTVVIGGESVYRALLPYVDRVYVTKLQVCPVSDAFFPNLDGDPAWRVAEEGEEQTEDGVSFRFLTYERKPGLLISACLAGEPCRYDGKANALDGALLDRLGEKYALVPVCPEVLGGLPTPRIPSEIRGDRVVNRAGEDVTEQFRRGAERALEIGTARGCAAALLKERSPSCGTGRIYDGTFSGNVVPGDGVTAALLRERGLRLLGETRAAELI